MRIGISINKEGQIAVQSNENRKKATRSYKGNRYVILKLLDIDVEKIASAQIHQWHIAPLEDIR